MQKLTVQSGAAPQAAVNVPITLGLDLVYRFDDPPACRCDTLLQDRLGRFYLADCAWGLGQCLIRFGRHIVPLKEAGIQHVKPVSICEALEWAAQVEPYSSGGYGNLAPLLQAAARAVKAGCL